MTVARATTRGERFNQYWFDIYLALKTTAVGMSITGRSMFEKKATLMYPEERPIIPVTHRGIHGFDEDLCISCDLCAAACPVDCIYIQSVGKGKDALMTQFDIDYTKCLFCDLCTPPCPEDCIWMTQEYDLASYSKEDCIMNFARTKTEDEIDAHKIILDEIAAKKKAAREARKKEAEAAAEAQAEKEAPATSESKASEEGAPEASQSVPSENAAPADAASEDTAPKGGDS